MLPFWLSLRRWQPVRVSSVRIKLRQLPSSCHPSVEPCCRRVIGRILGSRQRVKLYDLYFSYISTYKLLISKIVSFISGLPGLGLFMDVLYILES